MLALFVVLLSSVNTFLYFEQLNIVRDTFPDVAQRTQVFARIDYAVQTLTVLSQIFLTGRIAATFGVRALLVMVPLAMVAGFVVLSAALGGFVILAAVIILRRWGEYAFIRPGREMLFSRLDTESKYKAKSLIDVPVYRGADMLVAQLQNALRQGGLSSAGVALLGAGAGARLGGRRDVAGAARGARRDALRAERLAPRMRERQRARRWVRARCLNQSCSPARCMPSIRAARLICAPISTDASATRRPPPNRLSV